MRLFDGKILLDNLPDELPSALKATLTNWRDQKSLHIATSGSTSEPKSISLLIN